MRERTHGREKLADAAVDGRTLPVEVDADAGRFELRAGDEVAFLDFSVAGTAFSLNHTEVPRALRGRGLGEALAAAALRYARSRGMTVRPYCPFVSAYIKRHPEYRPLVDPSFSGAR
jgi:predicted GNAT family acetyltransferase